MALSAWHGIRPMNVLNVTECRVMRQFLFDQSKRPANGTQPPIPKTNNPTKDQFTLVMSTGFTNAIKCCLFPPAVKIVYR